MLALLKPLLTALLLFLSFSIFSQATFERFYGDDSTEDILTNIQPTADDGYVLVGETQSSSNSGDFHLVKLDEHGAIEFSKEIGTPNIERAHAVAVLEMGYVIGGTTFVDGSNERDCYLVTVDFGGNLIQEVVFGGEGDDVIYALTALENGDIAVAASYENTEGTTGADFHIRRYSPSLDLLAEILHHNNRDDMPSFVIEDKSTGNILVGGSSNTRGFLMNCSSQLDTIVWTVNAYSSIRTGLDFSEDMYAVGLKESFQRESYIGFIDKSTGQFDEPIPLPEADFGGYTPLRMEKVDNQIYLFASRSNTTAGRLFLKYDLVNDLFSEEFVLEKTARDMAVSQDGELAVVAGIPSDIYRADIVKKLDEYANEHWSVTIGDLSEHSIVYGSQLIASETGDLYLGGDKRSGSNFKASVIVNKIDSDGSVIWESALNLGSDNRFAGIAKGSDGGCIVAFLYSMTGFPFDRLGFQKINPDGTPDWFEEVDISEYSTIWNGNLASDDNDVLHFSGTVSGGASLYGGVLYVKFDVTSSVLDKQFISIPDGRFSCNKMIVASDHSVLISGREDIPSSSEKKPTLIRIDPDGEILWKATLEANPFIQAFEGIAQEGEGPFLLTDGENTVSKIDIDGTVLDTLALVVDETFTNLEDICVAEDSSIYVLNHFFKIPSYGVVDNPIQNSCIVVHHYDKDYNLLDTYIFGEGRGAIADRIYVTDQGKIFVYGTAVENNNTRGYLVGIDQDGVSSAIDIHPKGFIKVFPTVSSGDITLFLSSEQTGKIHLSVFDINGRVVQSSTHAKDGLQWEKALNISQVPAGKYFIQARIGVYAWTKQVIKQ